MKVDNYLYCILINVIIIIITSFLENPINGSAYSWQMSM